MTVLHQTPSGPRLIVAQTQAAPSTIGGNASGPKAQEKIAKPSGPPATKPGGTGVPKFEVKPDLSGIPGAQTAGQSGINLVGGLVLMAIVIFTLIGIGRMAIGTGFDMPDHSQGGKKMLLYAVPLAFAASLVGELVGWGFTLGVS
jgi:hypothetical protein